MLIGRQRGDCAQGYICLLYIFASFHKLDPVIVVIPWNISNGASTYVFPSQGSGALDTVNVSNGVVTSRHLAVIGFSLDHIDAAQDVKHRVEQETQI
jgi:hypothetical protein